MVWDPIVEMVTMTKVMRSVTKDLIIMMISLTLVVVIA
jgi:hypothetical protein